jgi:hypothetical protein
METSRSWNVTKMNNAARSMFIFGIYVTASGISILVIPDGILTLFGLSATNDIWIRFLGLILAVLGGYYVQSARNNLVAFFEMTVIGRLMVAAGLLTFVVIGIAKPMMLVPAAGDFLGAMWTAFALRRSR